MANENNFLRSVFLMENLGNRSREINATVRLPQISHLHLESNTIMSCNKYKKNSTMAGKEYVALLLFQLLERSPDHPNHFVFLPRQAFLGLSLPVTLCIARQKFYYQLPLRSVVLLGSPVSRVLSSNFSVVTVLASTTLHCFLQ